MVDQVKILICGDVEGKFNKLYSRIKNVNKKSGPFDLLFCVGNFFGASNAEFTAYKSGQKKVPVPTYVLGPNSSEQSPYYPEVNGCDLAPDITYLGKRGLFTTNSGLTVAYVSGIENSNLPSDCCITSDDTDRVRTACTKNSPPSYRGIDILLTSTWPENVTKLDDKFTDEPPKGSQLISKLAYQVKPRYHFFGLSQKYYERSPYKNEPTPFGSHFTRAIALANVGNEAQKWLYALNVTPLVGVRDYELYRLTTDTTECPYNVLDDKAQQYFYDMNYKESRSHNKRKNREDYHQRAPKMMNVSQDECWFCLASPKFEKHLIISIGDEAYLTMAKGGLVWDHVMILPISHYRTFNEMPQSLVEEMEKFKKSLIKYFDAQGKRPVFYDRNYKTPHYQIQVIPVVSSKFSNLKEQFMESAEQKRFSLTEIPNTAELRTILQSEMNYFYVEFGNERLFHSIKKHFPLQFAREVLAQPAILDAMNRIQWKDIESSKEDETETVERFRSKYKMYDFTV